MSPSLSPRVSSGISKKSVSAVPKKSVGINYILYGNHGNSYSYDFYQKWAQVGKDKFRILAFKTESKY